MIITRTPLRVSFLGGGTDYPDHFRKHGGQTLALAIAKYSYVTVNELAPLFDYSIRVGYSRTELANNIDEIEHPSVRECLRFMKLDGGIEIGYGGDLPARTGLGSSSSFTVGLLHALHAYKGELVSHQQLAEEAVHVEQQMIKERVGVQDQFVCAHGGLLHVRCPSEGRICVEPVPLSGRRLADLQNHLMLFYTGLQRHAHEVLEEQLERTRQGVVADDLRCMSELVDQGLALLSDNRPLTEFGEVLHSAWETKRRLSSKISNAQIDGFYNRAREAGAVGGKLLGAGTGGFLLLLAKPDAQPAIRCALPELREVSLRLDRRGSVLLFYNHHEEP